MMKHALTLYSEQVQEITMEWDGKGLNQYINRKDIL